MTTEPGAAETERPGRPTEDWAAVAAGLLLIAAVLVGLVPEGLVP